MLQIKTLTVLGTGVLGSQIAYQAAFHGFAVTAYDIDADALAEAEARFARLAGTYRAAKVAGAAEGKAEAALGKLRLTADLGDAVADADLVIEAVPELLELKREVYRKLADLAPAKTIFATNSSTLLPSDLKESTGRADRFLALHYANNIWAQNIAEVMGTADTDPAVFDAVVEFARNSGLEPIEIRKEKAGYVLNSLLVPLLNAAAGPLAAGRGQPGNDRQDVAHRHRSAERTVPDFRRRWPGNRVQHCVVVPGRRVPGIRPVPQGQLHRPGQARRRDGRRFLYVLTQNKVAPVRSPSRPTSRSWKPRSRASAAGVRRVRWCQ